MHLKRAIQLLILIGGCLRKNQLELLFFILHPKTEFGI